LDRPTQLLYECDVGGVGGRDHHPASVAVVKRVAVLKGDDSAPMHCRDNVKPARGVGPRERSADRQHDTSGREQAQYPMDFDDLEHDSPHPFPNGD
jgi:hypothetical protein